MNTDKHRDVFNPIEHNDRIHILGCGAVGSTVTELLVRLGLTKITLWDFDVVNPHNVANQMFTHADIGKPKVTALYQHMLAINPEAVLDMVMHCEAYKVQPLSGWIFVNIDDIDQCREVIKIHRFNPNVKGFLDFRLGLMDGQHYAAVSQTQGDVDRLLATMDFTHAEAKVNTPVSACGSSLNVVPGVRLICSLGIGNFMNILQDKPYKHMILSNADTGIVDAF